MELQLQPLNLPSDQERAFIIAGPCSAEKEEQVMTTAKQLAGKGCHIFRAGVWKPRTKPGGFEGHGEPALLWMKQVKEETGITMEVDRLGFIHENYFYGDAPTNLGKQIYEISFFFYMKTVFFIQFIINFIVS